MGGGAHPVAAARSSRAEMDADRAHSANGMLYPPHWANQNPIILACLTCWKAMNFARYANAMSFNTAVVDVAAATALTGGMQVERMVTQPGKVTLEPVADHRIKIHTGTPVTGTCHIDRFMYQHGDIDLLPAGITDSWVEDVASTSVILRFPPALMAHAMAALFASIGLVLLFRMGKEQNTGRGGGDMREMLDMARAAFAKLLRRAGLHADRRRRVA